MLTRHRQQTDYHAISPFLHNSLALTCFGAVAAFCTYACMYAFRKGITATTFDGMRVAGVDYKIGLITAQVLGYAVSKAIGIKVVSEVTPARRVGLILLLVGAALLALLGLPLVPVPYNILCLFLNGLPLGMVYGLTLGFLEGRRQTDAMVAGLTTSFIFASGFVKTVALTVKDIWGVSDFWLPFVTGTLFVVPLLLAVYALALLPPPTPADRALRSDRRPMNQGERQAFVRTYQPGLFLLIASYVLLSAFRDFRDNFGPEILRNIGRQDAGLFARTETIVAVGVLVLMAGLQRIGNNFRAFALLNGLMLAGGLLVGSSTWLYQIGLINAELWFLLTGLGVYMAYVPCNGLYFERLVASFRIVGTVGFMVTLADWYGYLGSVAVLLYKNFGQPSLDFQQFFIYGAYCLSALHGLLVLASFVYFRNQFVAQISKRESRGLNPPYAV